MPNIIINFYEEMINLIPHNNDYIDHYLYFINNVRGRTVGKGSEELLRGMFKKTRILSPKTKIQTGEDKANIEKIFKENFQ